MITYSTNWMGPINNDFIKKYGENWAGGRIDIYTGGPYPEEYSLPIMSVEDWNSFSEWIHTLKTETIWSYDNIIEEYEKTHSKIQWLRKD